MEEQMEDKKKVYADVKFIEETPIEEVNELIRMNKLTFLGNKASELWREKNGKNKTKKDDE